MLSVFAGGRTVTQAGADRRARQAVPEVPARPKQLFADWPNEAFIYTGYSSPGREQIFDIGKRLNEPFHDRLFFAGEHTQLDHFGYMEGAIRSGERAAGQIIDAVCGRRQAGRRCGWPAGNMIARTSSAPTTGCWCRTRWPIPNRWICAIDVYENNPAWVAAAAAYRLTGRGTGVLIGSPVLLTAAHNVVDRAAAWASAWDAWRQRRTRLGRPAVKTSERPAVHRRPGRPAGRPDAANVPFQMREDYAC